MYYLNNMDGAQVFGHNAMLLVDDNGNGKAYSFMDYIPNDNQLNHFRLTNESRMGYTELSPDMVEKFLQDGDITFIKYHTGNVDENGNPTKKVDGNCITTDNYDRALRKKLTEEEYQILLDEMKSICMDGDIKYFIYAYNCDTAVVDAISKIDSDFNGYGTKNFKNNMLNMLMLGPKDWVMRNLTPNTSFNSIQERVLGRISLNRWELVYMGDIDIKEAFLKDIQKFTTEPEEVKKSSIEEIYLLFRGIGRKIECIE